MSIFDVQKSSFFDDSESSLLLKQEFHGMILRTNGKPVFWGGSQDKYAVFDTQNDNTASVGSPDTTQRSREPARGTKIDV